MNREEIFKWYEKEFEDLSEEIKSKEKLSYLDFLRIRNFKLQNSSREKVKKIEDVTNESFELAKNDEIEGAILNLLKLHGVAIPIASTILAIKFPEKFCIIDRVVLKNLKKEDWLKDYLTNPNTYKQYILLMRKLANEKKQNLRDFERGLFEQRKINL